MKEILFLSHRIPYPPDKGDKIRSWNLLLGLSSRYLVHLATFVDDPADMRYQDVLRRTCGAVLLRRVRPQRAKLRGLFAMLGGSALTMGYYNDRVLRQWVDQLAAERPLLGVFAYSSSMAQYAVGLRLEGGGGRIADFCDVDSDKWRQYSESSGWPLSGLYGREARLLQAEERKFAMQFDATLVVSSIERDLLCRIAPEAVGRIRVVGNGVDTQYYDPVGIWDNPFPKDSQPVVFTGAMDYHPNVDGVVWFANEVLPVVRKNCPSALFAIVGSNPESAVRSLAARPGIVVTGRVPDVRPYLAHAQVTVAPLRIARGVQNKVLEALAMGRNVVATENAVQGIPSATEAGVIVASSASDFAEAVISRIGSTSVSNLGRNFVLQRFGWPRQVSEISSLLEGEQSSASCQNAHKQSAPT